MVKDFLDYLVIFGKLTAFAFMVFGIVCFFASMGDGNRRMIHLEDQTADMTARMDVLEARYDYYAKD